jgi:N-acetylneuraminic acid mutarotase
VASGWQRIAPGALSAAAVTVWTGKEVLMWGGGCCGNSSADGVAYNPTTNTWSKLPRSPLPGRQQTVAAWTGKELIVAGGNDADGNLFADAASYDPASGNWRKLPSLPAPRTDATATWDGEEVLVVGGRIGGAKRSVPCDCAHAYNPATGHWRQLPSMPYARSGHAAVWTGSQLLVWGGENGLDGKPAAPPSGVAFDPVTMRWSQLPRSPLRGRTRAHAVWTGTTMLIWGGQTINDSKDLPDGAAYSFPPP